MLVGVGVLLVALGLYGIHRWYRLWTYWERLGVASYGHPPPVGCMLPFWTGRYTLAQLTDDILRRHPTSPAVGTWILNKPVLVVKDPDLVHEVLSEKWSVWPDRGFRDDPSLDPLSQHLINITGRKWRLIRSWLASAFGMTALRHRHGIFLEESRLFVRSITARGEADAVRSSKRTALAVLTRYALGTSHLSSGITNFIEDIFNGSLWLTLRSSARLACPRILRFLGSKRFSTEQELDFLKFVDKQFESVQADNDSKKNILDILIESYRKHKISNDFCEEITSEVIASNALVVLAAGYDTTATTLAWLLYELARHPDVQDRIHGEVHGALSLHGQPSAAAVHDMPYLDHVISEILRMYPSVIITSRVSCSDTTVDSVTIPSGTRVVVPIYSIQRSPHNFHRPDAFDPDRFAKENINKMAFIPFGKGPRICLGWRLARLMIKLSIITLVKDFTLSLSTETKEPIGYKPFSVFLSPKQPIMLKLSARK